MAGRLLAVHGLFLLRSHFLKGASMTGKNLRFIFLFLPGPKIGTNRTASRTRPSRPWNPTTRLDRRDRQNPWCTFCFYRSGGTPKVLIPGVKKARIHNSVKIRYIFFSAADFILPLTQVSIEWAANESDCTAQILRSLDGRLRF